MEHDGFNPVGLGVFYSCHRFQRVVGVNGDDYAFGKFFEAVSASANALDEAADLPWRHVLDCEVDVADVYAEFECAGADDGFEFAVFEFVFDVYAFFFA